MKPSFSTRHVVAASAALYGLHTLSFRHDAYTIDDAWIPARVARTFLNTGLPTFDATGPLTEATSSPLWWALHLLSLTGFPAADPVPYLRLLGGLCGVACVALACSASAESVPRGRRSRDAALITGAILVAHSGLAMHAVNGLESSAWWLTCLLGVHLWRRDNLKGVTAVACVLILLRPEGLLWGSALAIGAGWRARRFAPLAWSSVTLATLLWWRFSTYGEFLPNTAYAKAPELGAGLTYVVEGVVWTGGLVLLLALRRAPVWTLAGVAVAASVVATGGDWMPGHRRLGEAQILWAIAAGIAGANGGLARLAAALWWSLVTWQTLSGQATARWYHEELADVGERANRTAGVDRIAAFDVGRIGWAFEGSVHDLAGLTDRRIGQRPGAHGQKAFDAALFDAQLPKLVVLTSTNDPSSGAPSFIRAEEAVYSHLASRDDYVYAGRKRVGSPDQILIFVHDSVELTGAVWADWPDP